METPQPEEKRGEQVHHREKAADCQKQAQKAYYSAPKQKQDVFKTVVVFLNIKFRWDIIRVQKEKERLVFDEIIKK